MRRAAMLALWVGDDYLILRGERAIANGWFQRAARILEGLDDCPEHGWLDALLGYVATIDGDTATARELAIRARELGRRLGVVSLEMFAVGVEGLALVNEGDVADGMARLDEATTAALAGEFEEIVAAGWTFCFCSTRASGCVTSSGPLSGSQGRGVQPADADQLRDARLPRALRCRAHLAGPLARGREVAHRGGASRPRATLLGWPDDRAARRPAPPAGTVRRGGGASPAGARQRARTGGHGRARPRPGRCIDRSRPARARPSAGPGGEQDFARPRRSR